VSANERRPAGAPSEACWPSLSVPEPADPGTDDTTADLWSRFYNLPSTEYIDGYGRGWEDGAEHGRQLAEDEQRGRGAISAAVAAQMARLGSFADLCEARGEPARAARSRQTLADRGI